MELHHHNFPMHMGGDPSEYPEASGHTTHEFLAQMCSQDIMFLGERCANVHIRATRAGIHSGMGDTTTFDGKEDSKGQWYVVLVHISLAL
jgi:hypothetical protein